MGTITFHLVTILNAYDDNGAGPGLYGIGDLITGDGPYVDSLVKYNTENGASTVVIADNYTERELFTGDSLGCIDYKNNIYFVIMEVLWPHNAILWPYNLINPTIEYNPITVFYDALNVEAAY